MYFVYRFIDENENIIYVGKTENLDNRMKQHFTQYKFIEKECHIKTRRIEYIELSSEMDMTIVELYFINKWKPRFNTASKQNEELSLIINEEFSWKVYDKKIDLKVDKISQKTRDFQIQKSLEKLKCLTTGQIAALHFSSNANPIVSANKVLKRLRMSNHIIANTDRSFQQYVYFLNPSPIKINSNKLNHYLEVANVYTYLQTLLNDFSINVHQEYKNKLIKPDLHIDRYIDNEIFIEVTNGTLNSKVIEDKLDNYKQCYSNKEIKNPVVILFGGVNGNVDVKKYPFKIIQVNCIEEFVVQFNNLTKVNSNVIEFKSSKKIS